METPWVNRSGVNLDDKEELLGFIYKIREKEGERYYIGRKQFWSKRGRYWYESDWRYYRSSSRVLRGYLGSDGDDGWIFEILAVFTSKSALRYAEAAGIIWSEGYINESEGLNGEFAGCKGRLRFTDIDRQQIRHLEEVLRDDNTRPEED